MKKIVSFVLVIVLMLSVGTTLAYAKRDLKELYGIWHCDNASSDPAYISISEGGIGFVTEDLESEKAPTRIKWEIEDDKYIKIESAPLLGTGTYIVLRIDQDGEEVVLTDMFYAGALESVRNSNPETIKKILKETEADIGSLDDDTLMAFWNYMMSDDLLERYEKVSAEDLLDYFI